MAELELRDVAPTEAIRFFENKSKLLRESFAWQDVWQEEHARQFTVAKSAGRAILEDIFSATKDAIANGETFETFQKRLTPILQEKGWWGRSVETDPQTGEEVNVQLGSTRRLRTIYDVNVRMAFAAGKWERIQRTKDTRPYLLYDAVDDNRTRPLHHAWDNTILPVDDPWWSTHFPPNGWNCRCSVISLSETQYERMKKQPGVKTQAPPPETKTWTNNRTGQTIDVPKGIDPGFGYNVGRSHLREQTPPPLPDDPSPSSAPTLYPPAGRPPLPTPKAAPAPLMPPDLPARDYVDAFMGEVQSIERARSNDVSFDIGDGAVLKDKLGLPITITDRFLMRDDGSPKLDSRRAAFVRLLAQTLFNPQEIWLSFEPLLNGLGYTLRRRYVARYEIAAQNAIVVIEESKDGWRGVTAFVNMGSDNYLDNRVRDGFLAYRDPSA